MNTVDLTLPLALLISSSLEAVRQGCHCGDSRQGKEKQVMLRMS